MTVGGGSAGDAMSVQQLMEALYRADLCSVLHAHQLVRSAAAAVAGNLSLSSSLSLSLSGASL